MFDDGEKNLLEDGYAPVDEEKNQRFVYYTNETSILLLK